MRRTTEFARRRGYCGQCDRRSASPSRVVRADATVVTNAALARRTFTDVTALATDGAVEEVAVQIDAGVAAHRLSFRTWHDPRCRPDALDAGAGAALPARTDRATGTAVIGVVLQVGAGPATAVGQPGVAHRPVGHARPTLARLISRAAQHA